MLRLTVSNSFLRSIKIPHVYFLLSILPYIVLRISSIACCVVCLLQNPYWKLQSILKYIIFVNKSKKSVIYKLLKYSIISRQQLNRSIVFRKSIILKTGTILASLNFAG